MFKSKRFYINILIFGSMVFLPFVPWYLPFIGAMIACWYMNYYEIILLGFLIDATFMSAHFFTIFSKPFYFPFTFLSFAILIALKALKNRLRLYS